MSEPRKDPKRGTWSFTVDVPAADGTRRQVHRRGFPTKKAANKAKGDLLAQPAGGTLADPSKVTTGDYLVNHWLPTLPGRVRPTTLDAYRRAVNGHLVPHLGTVRLQQLDAAVVQKTIARLSSAGLSPKYTRNIHGVLSKALADALRWRLVGVNVAAGVELPQVGPPAPRAWEAAQVARFLAATAEDRLGPLWRFVALTGVRRGEALGLRWDDLDLGVGTATITRQRVIAGGSVHEGPPKTRSGARTVALDAETVQVLRVWRKRQKEEFFRLAIRPSHALVFTPRTAAACGPSG